MKEKTEFDEPIELNAEPLFENKQEEDELNIEKTQYGAMAYSEELRNRTYTVEGKKASAKKNSKEMQELLDGMEGLNDTIDMMAFDISNKQDFVNSGMAIVDMMRLAASKCDAYLSAKNPWTREGKARKKLVKNLYERLSHDILLMEQKLRDFWTIPAEEQERIKSWGDFMNWERTVSYKDGADGVEISHTGGNTSDVIRIKKGDKTMYFKKEDELPPVDFDKMMSNRLSALTDTPENTVKEEGSVDFYKYNFMSAFAYEFPKSVTYQEIFKELRDIDTSGPSYNVMKKAMKYYGIADRGMVGSIIDSVEAIKDKAKKDTIKKALGDLFGEIRKEFISAEVATNSAQIQTGENLVKRNVATSRLAHLLNLDHLIPKSEMATIEVNNKKMYGVMMDEAQGEVEKDLLDSSKKQKEEYKGQRLIYTPAAFRDCCHLQLFDAICGQIDRHRGNRVLNLKKAEITHIKTNEKKTAYMVTKVQGIDSDMSFGNIDYSTIKYLKRSPEDENGLRIPIARETAEAILQLEPEIVDYEMKGILNQTERKNLIDRITGVQGAIRKRMKFEARNPNVKSIFFEKSEDWQDYMEAQRKRIKENPGLGQKIDDNTCISSAILRGTKIPSK